MTTEYWIGLSIWLMVVIVTQAFLVSKKNARIAELREDADTYSRVVDVYILELDDCDAEYAERGRTIHRLEGKLRRRKAEVRRLRERLEAKPAIGIRDFLEPVKLPDGASASARLAPICCVCAERIHSWVGSRVSRGRLCCSQACADKLTAKPDDDIEHPEHTS